MTKSKNRRSITKDILIEDLVREYPESVSLLMEYGVQCIACGEPVWGTLGERIQSKNLDPDPIMTALIKLESEHA